MSEILLLTDVTAARGWGRGGGAYRIATVLREAGFQVQTVDAWSSWRLQDLVDLFVDSHTLFVGISAGLLVKTGAREVYAPRGRRDVPGFPFEDAELQDFFAAIRRKGAKVVLGGGMIRRHGWPPGADYYLPGQAERSVVALARHLKCGEPLIQREPGLVSSADYPFQDFNWSGHIKWHETDRLMPGEVLPLELARGCIFRCAFCRFDDLGKGIGEYTRNWDSVRAEVLRNWRKFGVTSYLLCDDTINDTLDRVKQLREFSDSLPFRFTFSGYVRPDVIWRHREMRDLLLEAGLEGAFFGIETLHAEAGRTVGKGLGRERTLELLGFLRETWGGRVLSHGSFIVGLPGEPEESVWQTHEWLMTQDVLDSWTYTLLRLGYSDSQAPPVSRFEKEAEQFGFVRTGQHWQHATGSRDEMAELVARLYADPRDVERCNPCGQHWVGRWKNLGYTFEECLRLRFKDSRDEMRRRLTRQKAYREAVVRG